MATKTVIATGMSGGIGFELVKQLLAQRTHRFILGVRDPAKSRPQFDALAEHAKDDVTLLKLDLNDLASVQRFGKDAKEALGGSKLDFVLLNAAHSDTSKKNGSSRWCESYVVTHLSQHYLLHLLRDTIVRSHSRVIFTSSIIITMVKAEGDITLSKITEINTAGADAPWMAVYSTSKFAQVLNAHWWRRSLGKDAIVVAVSPGMVKNTALGRHTGMSIDDEPEATDLGDGAKALYAAFTCDDFPADPDAIFYTSSQEWWSPQKELSLTLDRALQDKYSPSQAEIEREAGL